MFEKKSLKIRLLIFAMLFSVVLSFCLPVVAYATETEQSGNFTKDGYTDVFNDLRKDSSFDYTQYPSYTYEEFKAKYNNATKLPFFHVFQIAEGYNKELFIYVYNPVMELALQATEILMYCEDVSPSNQNINPSPYKLELVSRYEVFDKYLVKDFVVCDEAYRYYNFVEISREYNPDIDAAYEQGDRNDVAQSVATCWKVYYFNGLICYEQQAIDVVEIIPVLTDYLLCYGGFTWSSLFGKDDYCCVQYIAFKVPDYDVKRIFDADVCFDLETFASTQKNTVFMGPVWSEPIVDPDSKSTIKKDEKVTLYESQSESYQGSGWFSAEFSWDRILTGKDFVNNLEKQEGVWNEDVKAKLNEEGVWVFAYTETFVTVETDYASGMVSYPISRTIEGVRATNIDVIRLHFLTDKGEYNLGVVMDKTTADLIAGGGLGPDLDIDFFNEWFEKLVSIFAILALLLVLIFLTPYITGFFKIVFSFLKAVFGTLIAILSAPFKRLKNPKGKK